MDSRDYNPDAITRSLGIGAFAPHWSERPALESLRALFCPSFHPELCVTFEPMEDGIRIEVAAARTQIWHLPAPGLVTTDKARATIGEPDIEALQIDLTKALTEPSPAVVMIDGMSIHFVSRSYNREITASDNPGSDAPLGIFAARLLSLAYAAIDDARCRNALSAAASYVGLERPTIEISNSDKTTTQMVVLGTPEEQAELLAALAVVAVSKDDPSEKR